MVRSRTNTGLAGRPPKPKPLKTRSIPDSAYPKPRFGTIKVSDPLDNKTAFNIEWLSPFIYGAVFGFAICFIIFEIIYQ